LSLIDDDPDNIPGSGPEFIAEVEKGFAMLDTNGGGRVSTRELAQFLDTLSPRDGNHCFSQPWKENYLEELTGGRAKADMTFEQYLQFAASWARRNSERTHNLCVVNCTTPAQYFHVLRRQIHRPYVKPLILMSPKYMLHHRACRSPIEAMEPGTFFYRVIIEGTPGDNMAMKGYEIVPNDEIKRVVFVSGKMFYELYHARAARKIRDVTFVRLEQIAPFPFDRMAAAAALYPKAQLVWAQEEPKNMGAYSYVRPRMATALVELNHDNLRQLRVMCRPVAAAATGLFRVHMDELKDLVDQVLTFDPENTGL